MEDPCDFRGDDTDIVEGYFYVSDLAIRKLPSASIWSNFSSSDKFSLGVPF
jgi:hypothetical protein